MKNDLYQKIVNYIIENQNKFYRLAYSYTRNQEDALDVVQSSACKALEHYGELRNFLLCMDISDLFLKMHSI